ncbi:SPW_0924 family protein [Streptomyces clavuligerus]|nr:SPW_0924 family protein [Streptomyces clavuligerus]
MRPLAPAALGLAAAVALVLTATAIGPPQDGTSPEPLLTTVPGPKK